MGKLFIWLGVAFLLIGAVLTWAPQLLSWFGKLPGDIDYQSGNTRVFFPITSMIVISVVLSILLNLFLRK
ncbi:MAG TPA: DUF2905 domain-containing protein [Piscirickettsiaceae bacterium]|nr:DUF2905 domain-containing protein [Piscirickettsiaceae bacterium]HIQ40591.1 DUF2905 domain-containing protein [Sulfurivirga caldicuralii]